MFFSRQRAVDASPRRTRRHETSQIITALILFVHTMVDIRKVGRDDKGSIAHDAANGDERRRAVLRDAIDFSNRSQSEIKG